MSKLEAMAVALFIYVLWEAFYYFGRRIIIPEIIAVIAVLEIVFVSALNYAYLPNFMQVDSNTYLEFTVPAVIAFLIGLRIGRKNISEGDHQFQQIRDYLANHPKRFLPLMVIGFIGAVAQQIYPGPLSTFYDFLITCANVGALYAYYSSYQFKYIAIVIAFGVLLVFTILQGMFGGLFYWTMLWAVFIGIDKSIAKRVSVKLFVAFIAIFTFLFLQSLKFEYRQKTWGDTPDEREADPELMLTLVKDRLENYEKLFAIDMILGSSTRLNTGTMIASALATVPNREPYADGEVLASFIYPFIPRFLWEDKPKTGGFENIKRFTTLPQYANNSINISPIGEGYVNFGIYGGILFAFFYGALIAFCYNKVIALSSSNPTIILWVPALFFAALNMETDLFSVWGTFVLTSLYTFFIYKLFGQFNIKL